MASLHTISNYTNNPHRKVKVLRKTTARRDTVYPEVFITQ